MRIILQYGIKIFLKLMPDSWKRRIPDHIYLKLRYYQRLGIPLNIKEPKSFNEKLQWLKLYDRKPEYTMMVDKYEVKKYISETVGEEYVVPTLGVWNHFDEIDFDALPDQFVLKCTHDSGGLVICRDKATLDKNAAKAKIERCLKRNYYYSGREWPYKNVVPRIIAENYLEDQTVGELRDYKWYCFQGVPKLMAIFCDRSVGATTGDYFDESFRHQNLTWGYPMAKSTPEKPYTFERMKQMAMALSKDIPCLRVDFYEVDGKPYIGELTFYDGSGFDLISPSEWDFRLGSWIVLPDQTKYDS